MTSIKKIFTTLALALGLCLAGNIAASAQNVFQTGSRIASIGIGANLHTDAKGHQNGQVSLDVSSDYCLTGNVWDENSAFTLGGQGVLNMGGWGVSYFLGPRAGLHYHFIPQLDTYVFLALGFDGWKSNEDKSSSFGFGYNAGLGIRYMVTPSWGIFAEGGYGASLLNVGASFAF
jgi:hypothetical protein